MKNQHRVFLFVSGLLFFSQTVRAMDRSDRTTEYTMMYRGLSERELLNELKKLELQLAAFMDKDDFAVYMQEPDQLNFLHYQLYSVGNTMPPDMLYCVQKIIAALSVLKVRSEQSKALWGEFE